jgi:hypothetical protein
MRCGNGYGISKRDGSKWYVVSKDERGDEPQEFDRRQPEAQTMPDAQLHEDGPDEETDDDGSDDPFGLGQLNVRPREDPIPRCLKIGKHQLHKLKPKLHKPKPQLHKPSAKKVQLHELLLRMDREYDRRLVVRDHSCLDFDHMRHVQDPLFRYLEEQFKQVYGLQ